jgi:FLVCR family MFS transporter 7
VNHVANPVGGALGQLISPLVGDTRQSVRFSNFNFVVVLGWDIDPKVQILILGIMSTVVAPLVLLIQRAPPTPPSMDQIRSKFSFANFIRSIRCISETVVAHFIMSCNVRHGS